MKKINALITATALTLTAVTSAIQMSASAELIGMNNRTEQWKYNDMLITADRYTDGTIIINAVAEETSEIPLNIKEFIQFDNDYYKMTALDGILCENTPFSKERYGKEKTSFGIPMYYEKTEYKPKMKWVECDYTLPETKKDELIIKLKFELINELELSESTTIDAFGEQFRINGDEISNHDEYIGNDVVYGVSDDLGYAVFNYSIHKNGDIDVVAYNRKHDDYITSLEKNYVTIPTYYDIKSTPVADDMHFTELINDDVKGYETFELPEVTSQGAFFWFQIINTDKDSIHNATDSLNDNIKILDKEFNGDFLNALHKSANKLSGDSNCDGEVNMADAVLIMQYLSSPDRYTLTAQGKINADCTSRQEYIFNSGDGVTNADALEIQRYILKLIDSLTDYE